MAPVDRGSGFRQGPPVAVANRWVQTLQALRVENIVGSAAHFRVLSSLKVDGEPSQGCSAVDAPQRKEFLTFCRCGAGVPEGRQGSFRRVVSQSQRPWQSGDSAELPKLHVGVLFRVELLTLRQFAVVPREQSTILQVLEHFEPNEIVIDNSFPQEIPDKRRRLEKKRVQQLGCDPRNVLSDSAC